MNKRIIFFPTKSRWTNSYLNNIYNTIKDHYEVTGCDEIKKKDYFKYDIYHFNWIESTIWNTTRLILTIIFIYILKILNKKIIRTMHNTIPHETGNKKEVIKFMQFIAKKSDRIHILCTETLKNNILQPYKDKTILIPHWDYIGNYPLKNLNIYNKYGIPTNKKIALFIGQIRKYKNIDLLIKAFKASKLEDNNVVMLICWICNDKIYRKELEKLEDKNIYIDFNFIKDSDMEAYLRQCKIIIAPYNKISSLNSWTLWMAMSYKKTMMLPLIWCVKDIKNYNDFLYIYDYYKEDHYEKLLECMLKLKNDLTENRNILNTKWEKAYEYIIKNQSWEVQKKNRINLYKFQ